MHILRTGEAVAVKVVRTGVAGQFAADLASIDLLTAAFEQLTVVRPGFFVNLRLGVRSMFSEELDLRLEARYQTLFKRFAERDGAWTPPVVSGVRQFCGRGAFPATKIHSQLSRHDP